MSEFDTLWRYITKQRPGVITVQNREELEYIFNLIQGCESYLEVGTAEGNSLYVLSHALKEGAPITFVDYGESHTLGPRNEIIKLIKNPVTEVLGDSNDSVTAGRAKGEYDVVFIDAGHSYENVLKDALSYGPMAKKFILFHDIQLPDVNQAFEWYSAQRPDCKVSRVVNSESFGMGVLEIV